MCKWNCSLSRTYRVKSGIFGQTVKFGQRPCLLHISNIGIKNKLIKQIVKSLMRRLIRSRLIWIYTVRKYNCTCPNLPDVRIYPTLPSNKYTVNVIGALALHGTHTCTLIPCPLLLAFSRKLERCSIIGCALS